MVVFDKGNIIACVSSELYVGAGQEVKCCLLETTLWIPRYELVGRKVREQVPRVCSLLGTAKIKRPSSLAGSQPSVDVLR